MKIIELKGFKGLLAFVLLMALSFVIMMGLPSLVVWITWNALVGECLHGPMFSFLQAFLLTAILFVLGQIILQPKWQLELRKTDPSDPRHDKR